MYTVTPIAPTMPDISEKIPEQMLMHLQDKKAQAFEKNTNSIGQLTQLMGKALSNINDPDVKNEVEKQLAPYQEQIDQMTNTLKTNPREVSYMTNSLNQLGLDLAKEMTSGISGRMIDFSKKWNESRETMSKVNPDLAYKISNMSNPYYQDSLQNIRDNKPVIYPILSKEPNMNEKIHHIMQGAARNAYGMQDISVDDKGVIKTKEGKTLEYTPEVERSVREALMNDPDISSYYDSMSKFLPNEYGNKYILKRDKTGRDVYYGSTIKGKGETINPSEALSRKDYEVDKAINIARSLYLSPVKQIDEKVDLPSLRSENKDANKGKIIGSEAISVGSGTEGGLSANPDQVPTDYNLLRKNSLEANQKYSTLDKEVAGLKNSPDTAPGLLKQKENELENARIQSRNLDNVLKHVQEIAWNNANLTSEEKRIYKTHQEKGDTPLSEGFQNAFSYVSSPYIPYRGSNDSKVTNEIATYTNAKKKYDESLSKSLAQLYPTKNNTPGIHNYTSSLNLGVSQSATMNKQILSNISASGDKKITTTDDKGKPVDATYQEFSSALDKEDNPIDKVTLVPNSTNGVYNVRYVTKALSNGKIYNVTINNPNESNQFLQHVVNNPNIYGSDAAIAATTALNPDARALIMGMSNAKNSLSIKKNSGPETEIRLPDFGGVAVVKKDIDGSIKYKFVMTRKDGSRLAATKDFNEVPDGVNPTLYIINHLQETKNLKPQ